MTYAASRASRVFRLAPCVALLACGILAFAPRSAAASGPFFTSYLYTPQDLDTMAWYPSPHDSKISASYPGIIFADTHPQYLFPIYRDLVGKKLPDDAQKAVFDYLDNGPQTAYDALPQAVSAWQDARAAVTGNTVNIDAPSYPSYFGGYVNCLPDAFLTATKTLEDRKSKYSKSELDTWIANQDSVFSECSVSNAMNPGDSYEMSPENLPPAPTSAGVPAPQHQLTWWEKIKEFFARIFDWFAGLFRKKPAVRAPQQPLAQPADAGTLFTKDKAYQEAAKSFYAGDFADAAAKFQAIADDASSPWRAYAALAVGRISLREALFRYDSAYSYDSDVQARVEDQLKADLRKPREQFQAILNDPALAEAHEGAQALLDFADTRLDPHGELLKAEGVLLSSRDSADITANLDTYAYLFHKDPQLLTQGLDFSQWAYAWTYPDVNSSAFALQRYAETKSVPWLLAALRFARPSDTLDAGLLDAAANLPSSSAGYWTAQYYRIKYLLTSGHPDQARAALNAVAPSGRQLPATVKNYIEDLKMQAGADLAGAFAHAQRTVIFTYDDYFNYDFADRGYDNLPMLDGKAKYMVEKFMPSNRLLDLAAQDSILSPQLTEQLRLVAFARAFALGDLDGATRMATLVAARDAGIAKDLQDFLAAGNAEDKRFAGAVFFLHYPGVSTALNETDDNLAGGWFDEPTPSGRDLKEIDSFRRNWWTCAQNYTSPYLQYGDSQYIGTEDDPAAADPAVQNLKKLFTADELARAAGENAKIYGTIAPNYLGTIVSDYAAAHSQDGRVPEALHAVVDATHYAECSDDATTGVSARAFRILHNTYPGNAWTQKTPYYY